MEKDIVSGNLSENASSIPLTYPGVHEKVIKFLEGERRGTLLDAGAGQGALSQKLAGLGFEVYACDLDPANFKAAGVGFEEVDLNGPLPYSGRFFDYVVCVEVIEHLENPHHLIRELARILKPGGKIIITSPNILDLVSRVRYLLYGSTPFETGLSSEYAEEHINLIGLAELAYIIAKNKLKILSVKTNRFKKKAYLLFPLLPVIKFLLWRISKAQKTNQELIGYLSNREVMMGEVIIVEAAKGDQ